MLQVPAFVFPSPIAGLGLFARDRIPAGTVIWRYDEEKGDWRVPLETLGQMDPRQLEFFSKYGYQPFKKDPMGFTECLPFVEMCGDFAMFMNHSETPNCDDPAPEVTVALRDIEAGEELTCNYRKIESRPIPFLETQHALGVPASRICQHVAGDLVQ